jgi:hypothetical protein
MVSADTVGRIDRHSYRQTEKSEYSVDRIVVRIVVTVRIRHISHEIVGALGICLKGVEVVGAVRVEPTARRRQFIRCRIVEYVGRPP